MPILRLDDLLADVLRRPAAGAGVRLVGVDGPSGSGKSTLAARLGARWCAPLIHVDDFVSWSDVAGWWPRFEEQVLTPLLAGADARHQARDWANDEFGNSLAGWVTTPWAPLVIVEGVTCTRGAAGDRLAYRIWVEAPDGLRLDRGLRRDGATHRRLWLDWMAAERQFFTADRTRARADLRVDGSPVTPHDPGVELVTPG